MLYRVYFITLSIYTNISCLTSEGGTCATGEMQQTEPNELEDITDGFEHVYTGPDRKTLARSFSSERLELPEANIIILYSRYRLSSERLGFSENYSHKDWRCYTRLVQPEHHISNQELPENGVSGYVVLDCLVTTYIVCNAPQDYQPRDLH